MYFFYSRLPAFEMVPDIIEYRQMCFAPLPFYSQGLAKGKVNFSGGLYLAKIFHQSAIFPGICQKGQRYHRDIGPFSQFDGNGAELFRVKISSCRLGKNNYWDPFGKPITALLQDGFQVLARVRTGDDNRLARTNYMFKDGATYECEEESDVDGLNGVDVSDVVFLVNFVFNEGPLPASCP